MQSPDGGSNTLNQALELLQKGDAAGAEKTVRQALEEAEKTHGANSVQAAQAQHDVGILLGSAGRLDEAIACLHKACSPSVEGEAAAKNRLTYELSLAAMLEQTGKIDEARKLIESNLAARKAGFGPSHPGYAIGLEQLGGFLMRHGDLEHARNSSEHAAAIYGNHGHPGIISALILRTEILKTMESPDPPYEGLEELPSALVEHLAAGTLERTSDIDPAIASAILSDLATFVEKKLGADHLASLHVWNQLANSARSAADHALREKALRGMIAGFDKRTDVEQGIEAYLALALAHSEAGEAEKALGAYKEAIRRGGMVGQPGHRTRGLRNMGMLLLDLDRYDEAEAAFRDALKDAETAKDGNNAARAHLAMGLLHRFKNENDKAKTALETGLAGLPASDPDAQMARHELDAVIAGKPYERLKPGDDIAEFIRDMVSAKAPPGLLAGLDIAFEGNQPDVQMKLAREASQEEMAMLEGLVQQAIMQFARHRDTKGN